MSQSLAMSPQDLAYMVGQLADSMLVEGATGVLQSSDVQPRLCCYSIELGAGAEAFSVYVALNSSAADEVASRLTGKPKEGLSTALMDDALMEWLNVMAGQVKSFCALEHEMGLPKRMRENSIGGNQAEVVVAIPQLSISLAVGLIGAHYTS